MHHRYEATPTQGVVAQRYPALKPRGQADRGRVMADAACTVARVPCPLVNCPEIDRQAICAAARLKTPKPISEVLRHFVHTEIMHFVRKEGRCAVQLF
jgi:hypothetical protein